MPASRLIHIPLLALGLALWLIAVIAQRSWPEQIPAFAALLISAALIAIPPIRRRCLVLLDRLANPSPHTRFLAAAAITALSFLYLAFTAHWQDRYLGPYWHDEHSYLLQAHMLALEGRLWMPAHEVGEFFESIFVFSQPVYASLYFPGTALALTPGVWLHLPTWVMPMLITSLAIGFTCRVIAELTDGVGGLLAAMLLLGNWVLRMFSTMSMSNTVLLLLAMMAVWAYLRWRGRPSAAWTLLIGILAGWAAITRPLDALCYALPLGVAMAFDLRGRRSGAWISSAILLLVSAAPFLVLQAALNKAVTGSYAALPWNLYNSRHFPQTTLGFHIFNPAIRPETLSPHKHAMHAAYGRELVTRHAFAKLPEAWLQRRIPNTVESALPHASLAILLPLGFLACFTQRRWILACAIPLYLAGYLFSPYYSFYYAVVIAPASALLVILAVQHLRAPLRLWLTLALLLLSLAQLPEARRRFRDQRFDPQLTRHFQQLLPQLQRPALILIRFSPGRNLDEQLVTNWRHPRPDDAPILLAHDLSERNEKLFRYYAARQPRRTVYLFDESSRSLTSLGTVADLAAVPIIPSPRQ